MSVGTVPFVAQMSDVDCGAACLSMALRCLGVELPLSRVTEAVGVGRDGVNALDICDGARTLGFRARAVRVDLDVLHLLKPGTILHWEMQHFVVFEKKTRDGGVVVVDPGNGRRRVDRAELNKALTGVAVLVEPGAKVEPSLDGGHPTRALWLRVLAAAPELPRVIIASVLLQLLIGAFPFLSAGVVDRVVPSGDRSLLSILGLALGWLACFFAAFTWIRGTLLYDLRTRLDLAGASHLLEHLTALPMRFFQERAPGDLMVRVRSNETLREALSSAVLASVLDGALIVLYVVALVVVDVRIAAVVVLLIAVHVVVYVALRRRHKELVAETQHRQGLAEAHLVDLLTGIETLKVSGAEGRSVSHWVSLYVDVLNATLRRGRLTVIGDVVIGTVRIAGPFLVLLIGTPAVLDGRASLGTMLAALALSQGIVLSIGTFLGSFGELDALSAVVDRLDDVLRSKPEQPGPRRPAPELAGAVRLEKISFKPTARSEPIVDELSLDVPAGAFVALVGPSGSGKSTVASLLAGLVEPTGGRVIFDGHDLATLDLGSVRRQLGVVVQRAQMFGHNIRENITMLEDVPMDEVEAAATKACIHDDIQAMGMRYLTPMLAGGNLAGGQRQRIALARALLRKPKVLILDEATSALDAITEHRIFENVQKMGCTRVVIAHRLSTIKHADLIVVMDGGRIVEQGRYDDLLAKGGLFTSLVSTQEAAHAG